MGLNRLLLLLKNISDFLRISTLYSRVFRAVRSWRGRDGFHAMVSAVLEAPGFRKAVIGETDKIQRKLQDIYDDSERILVSNLLAETKSTFRKASDSSRSYERRVKILSDLANKWFALWKKFKDDPAKIELIKIINSITDLILAYAKLFQGVTVVNRKKSNDKEEDLTNLIEGLSLISEVVEVFYGFFRISELQQLLSEINKLYSPNKRSRSIWDYFEDSPEVNHLFTQFKALCEFIISNLEKRIDIENADVKEWLSNRPISSSDWLSSSPESKQAFEEGLKQASSGKVRRRSFVDLEFAD